MTQVIVVETLERTPALRTLISSLKGAGAQNVLVIASTLPKASASKDNFISWSRGTLSKALEKALKRSSDNRFLLIGSEAPISEKQIRSLLSSAAKADLNGFAYSPLKIGGSLTDFPSIETKDLIGFLGSNKPVPGMCLMAGSRLLERTVSLACDSMVELAAVLFLISVTDKIPATPLKEQLTLSSQQAASQPMQLTPAECSRAVRLLLSSCNIEDLFPNHPWQIHQEESLAACYHYLSALFIRLADYDSAGEVLVLADQYEDSPRSLALRGLISARRRNWLDTTANFIAALQQYEARLKAPEGHYVQFAPREFQRINSVLLAGLNEVNKKDNRTAAGHFLEALSFYDSFYLEAGVASLSALE